MSDYLDVVFTAMPGPGNEAVFVEVERDGKSVRAGEWVQNDNGFATLRLTRRDFDE